MLLYDHCLTFDDEIELIWKARWRIPKILFLFLRYMVPICLVVNTFREPFQATSVVVLNDVAYPEMSGLTGIVSDVVSKWPNSSPW